MASYCKWCGKQHDGDRCPACARNGTTDSPPSKNPCDICGATPTWLVTTREGNTSTTEYLCPECDERQGSLE